MIYDIFICNKNYILVCALFLKWNRRDDAISRVHPISFRIHTSPCSALAAPSIIPLHYVLLCIHGLIQWFILQILPVFPNFFHYPVLLLFCPFVFTIQTEYFGNSSFLTQNCLDVLCSFRRILGVFPMLLEAFQSQKRTHVSLKKFSNPKFEWIGFEDEELLF